MVTLRSGIMGGERRVSGDISAAERWKRMQRGREQDIRRLTGARDRDPQRSRRQLRRYAAHIMAGTGKEDPFYKRVRRFVGHNTVVIDVGAGSGRFALPLARVAKSVIAVDPSKYMLGVLKREAWHEGLSNITPVLAPWEEAEGVEGDISICSFVLLYIGDAARFLEKMDRSARRRAFLYIWAGGFTGHFWRHFYGREPKPCPSYLDAAAVLNELGVRPQIETVESSDLPRYRDLSEAVAVQLDNLMLPNTPEIRRELREMLSAWLVRRDGMLRPPYATYPAQIISWIPQASRKRTGR